MATDETDALPTDSGRDRPDDAPVRRSRLLPMLVAVIALGIFAGIVWYAYTWGVGGVQDGALPVVQGPQQPEKERPESPGGLEIPHQDKLVLNQDDPTRVERLLPPPEAPQPPPTQAEAAPETPTAETPTAEAPSSEGGDPQPAAQAAPDEPGPEATTAPTPEPSALETQTTEAPETETTATEAQSVELAAEAEPAAGGEPPATQEEPPAAEVAAAPDPEPVPLPQVPPPPSTGESTTPEPATGPEPTAAPLPESPRGPIQLAALPAGSFVLQLASVRSEAAAATEWTRLQRRYASLLGELQLVLQRADLGDRGIFHRIMTGPFPNRATAEDLCAQLKSRGQNCLVKRT